MKDKPTLRKYLINKKLLLQDIYITCNDIQRKETILNELKIINEIIEICKERKYY